MARIGSVSSARRIYSWFYLNRSGEPAPEGWRRLGSGGTRTAFLNEAENVVYKVCTSDYQGYDNEAEVRNYRLLSRRKSVKNLDLVRLPKVTGYRIESGSVVIVAMEMAKGIIGTKASPSDAARRQLFSIGFGDMHGLNYFVDHEGIITPVDLASPLSERDDPDGYYAPDERCLNQWGGLERGRLS